MDRVNHWKHFYIKVNYSFFLIAQFFTFTSSTVKGKKEIKIQTIDRKEKENERETEIRNKTGRREGGR